MKSRKRDIHRQGLSLIFGATDLLNAPKVTLHSITLKFKSLLMYKAVLVYKKYKEVSYTRSLFLEKLGCLTSL